MTREEQEIVISRTAVEGEWQVYVSWPRMRTWLEGKGYTAIRQDASGAWFQLPDGALNLVSKDGLEKRRAAGRDSMSKINQRLASVSESSGAPGSSELVDVAKVRDVPEAPEGPAITGSPDAGAQPN